NPTCNFYLFHTVWCPRTGFERRMIRFLICTLFLALSFSLHLTPLQEDVLKCLYDIGLADFTGLLYLGCAMGGNCTDCWKVLVNTDAQRNTVAEAANCIRPLCCHG
ncbi:hypothetical protein Y032_0811g2464, partial [Ancylostoma ceylanicum]